MAYFRRSELCVLLDAYTENSECADEIESIYEQLNVPQNENLTLENLETLFNTKNCDFVTVLKYMRKKCTQIESQFEDFESIF